MEPILLTPFLAGAIVYLVTRVRPIWDKLPEVAQPIPAIALGGSIAYYLGAQTAEVAIEGALFGLSAIGGHHALKRIPGVKKFMRLGAAPPRVFPDTRDK